MATLMVKEQTNTAGSWNISDVADVPEDEVIKSLLCYQTLDCRAMKLASKVEGFSLGKEGIQQIRYLFSC